MIGETLLKEVFKECDKNNSGQITFVDLTRVLNSERFLTEFEPCFRWHVRKKTKNCANKLLSYKEFVELATIPLTRIKILYYVDKFLDWYCALILPKKRLQYEYFAEEDTEATDGLVWNARALKSPFKAFPYFTIILTLVQIVCFLTDLLLKGQEDDKDKRNKLFGPVAELLIVDPNNQIQLWRFVTYIFIHMGWTHLLSNVVLQILFGVALEMHQTYRAFITYLGGTIFASVLITAIFPSTRLVGASAGIYALITTHTIDIYLNRKNMLWSAIGQMIIFISFIAMEITLDYILIDTKSILTHVFGGISGLLLGTFVLKVFDKDIERNLRLSKNWTIIRWLLFVLYFLFLSAGILVHTFAKDWFPKEIN